MWRLEHIEVLWWWMLIPLFIIGVYWISKQRTKKIQQLGNPQKVKSLLTVAPQQTLIKRSLWLTAIACIVLAMANLQSGTEEESVTNQGSNVIVALDLSNSMLAKDVAPDRLTRSKKFLTDLVSKFGGDRVAFIVFAGRAYIQMPFTTDYGAFEMHLRSVHTDMIPTQGTALGEAIQVAESLQGSDKNQEKVLILLSDGEDHDSKAVNIARGASSNHLTIHTIGVGTRKGAPIPEKSRYGVAYKKDAQGNQVLSKLNEDVLKDIAAAGGGKYFNISDDKKALKEIQRSIKWAAGSTGEEKVYTRYKNYFQWFLFPAIILLMLEMASIHLLISNGRKSVTSVILLLYTILIFSSCKKEDSFTKAYTKYQTADYTNAIQDYQNLLQKDSSELIYFNLAASLLAANQPDSAMMYFEQLSKSSTDKSIVSQSHFNMGNIHYEKGDYKSALDAYSSALRVMPNNYRAQYNLSLALLHLPPQDQQDQQKDQDQQDQQDDQQNQDQNDSDKNQDQKKDGGDQDENDKNSKDQDQKDKNEQKKDPSSSEQEKKQEPKPQQQRGKLSPQDVQRLFQALDQQEKDVQKRILNLQGDQTSQPYIEKDW